MNNVEVKPLRKRQRISPILLTHEQMADALNVGRTTMDALVIEGCPRVWLAKRCVRYDPQDVRSWVKARNVKGSEDGESLSER